MNLWLTRRDWEKFARLDPFWAVLNEPGKSGNRWEIDAFFRTGRDDIAMVIGAAKMRRLGMGFESALDFGCGVGRASQALAEHFSRVVGVDISKRMLELASQYDRHIGRVTYVHNTRPDLAQFPDNSFDFVHSVITLQHIAPEYSRRYIAEFVRVLRPGGLAYFQVPFAVRPGDPLEKLRFSAWPPTFFRRVVRVASYRWQYHVVPLIARRPPMAMHALSVDEVSRIVADADADIVDIVAHPGAGPDCPSNAYFVVKRS